MQYKILVVEDDADINRLLVKILKEADYQTIQAFSGSEAKLLLEKKFQILFYLTLCCLEYRERNYCRIFGEICVTIHLF